jgi:hypothetical protein
LRGRQIASPASRTRQQRRGRTAVDGLLWSNGI